MLIAVIGDQWIERGSATGKRRIDDPRDQLRIELEVALGRNIPVIPVLVRKASMPLEEDLPPSLKSLAYRNGIQIRPDPDFSMRYGPAHQRHRAAFEPLARRAGRQGIARAGIRLRHATSCVARQNIHSVE